ncbi:MAG: DUF2190 family protein [Burkholderiaceae bacterium]|jgi:hypothetical protein|nr:DUF2190 family protein [Burkholderiaceae bacterium]
MKTQQVILRTSILAAVELGVFCFVGFDGALCAAGAKALGVSDTTASAGEQATVNTHGIMLVEAGGAIAIGAEVETGAGGRAVVLDDGVSNGIALDASSAAGDVIRIIRGI